MGNKAHRLIGMNPNVLLTSAFSTPENVGLGEWLEAPTQASRFFVGICILDTAEEAIEASSVSTDQQEKIQKIDKVRNTTV